MKQRRPVVGLITLALLGFLGFHSCTRSVEKC